MDTASRQDEIRFLLPEKRKRRVIGLAVFLIRIRRRLQTGRPARNRTRSPSRMRAGCLRTISTVPRADSEKTKMVKEKRSDPLPDSGIGLRQKISRRKRPDGIRDE
jgi:hypothetical protein